MYHLSQRHYTARDLFFARAQERKGTRAQRGQERKGTRAQRGQERKGGKSAKGEQAMLQMEAEVPDPCDLPGYAARLVRLHKWLAARLAGWL
jgi:hypothetical protein